MSEPRLYIIMRTDLASMNPGKGMAQAAHAANAFMASCDAMVRADEGPDVGYVEGSYVKWKHSTPQFFGTTITVSAIDEDEMIDTVKQAFNLGLPAEVIHDPTYPVLDGDVVHLIPVNTCAYVFVPDPDTMPRLLGRLPLHP